MMPHTPTFAFRSIDDSALEATPGDRRRASRPLFGARDAARPAVHRELGDDAPRVPSGTSLEDFIRAYDAQRIESGRRIAGLATLVAACRLRGFTSQRRLSARIISEIANKLRQKRPGRISSP